MLDLDTYNQTRHLPGGPVVQVKHIPIEDFGTQSVSFGVAIGRVLGLVVVIALGIYAYYAI